MTRTVSASATTTIDRPREEVFSYVSAVETMEEWVDGVANMTPVIQSEAVVGDTYSYEYTTNGRTSEFVIRVSAYDPPSRIRFETLEGSFPFHSELTLTPEGNATILTNAMEAGSDGRFTAFMFRFLRPVVSRLMQRQLQSELDTLADTLNSRPSAQTTHP